MQGLRGLSLEEIIIRDKIAIIITFGDEVPLGVRGSLAHAVAVDLPEGVEVARTVTETNDRFSSRRPKLTPAIIKDLELGKMTVATGVGRTDEPVASIAVNNVEIGNVALLLADTELPGTLKGLVNRRDRPILIKQLEERIERSRHITNRSCANDRLAFVKMNL